MLALEFHRDLAVAHHIGEIRQLVTAYGPGRSGKDHLQIVPFLLGPVDGHDRRDRDTRRDRQDVHDSLALGSAAAQRQAPRFQLVDHAIRRKEQQLRVGIGDKEGGDHVLFLCLHRGEALAAAPLRPEIGQRGAFDIAARSDRDDHVLTLNQVLVVHIRSPFDDLRPTGHGELVAHLGKLIADDLHDPFARSEDFKVFADFASQFLQLVRHFLDPDLGQALQT